MKPEEVEHIVNSIEGRIAEGQKPNEILIDFLDFMNRGIQQPVHKGRYATTSWKIEDLVKRLEK